MSDIVPCIITDLKNNPFSRRSFQDKLNIVKNGKPCPEITDLVNDQKDKNRSYQRHFNVNNYEKFEWVTGSSVSKKLYCWPCLLFNTEKNVWSFYGFSNLNNFVNATKKHEISQKHLSSIMQLKCFGKNRIETSLCEQERISITNHNQQVKKNREVLKRLIDCVCHLAIHELPFRGHSEGEDSVNKGNYRGTLELISKYDEILDNHLKTATVFKGTSNRIQNDLIRAISSVIIKELMNEIKSADYVAILLDETSDISNASQLSTVIRYIKNDGEATERFICFDNISSDRSADALFSHIDNFISKNDLSRKIVAQTYDGAAVMAGHLGGLRAKVEQKYPSALFVHCLAHRLNLVLSQSASNISDTKIFFKTLSGVSNFFSHSTKRTDSLKDFSSKKMPKTAPTRWNFSSRLVNTLYENINFFEAFFNNIVENNEHWDPDTIVSAQGFLNFIQNYQTKFLLKVFSSIFCFTDVLFNILQNKHLDILFCLEKVNSTKNAISEMREKFDEYFDDSDFEDSLPKRRRSDSMTPRQKYKVLYYSIIDHVVMQMNERFVNLEKFSFMSLLDPSRYKDYVSEFPTPALNCLKTSYGNFFDFVRLKNELVVFYSFSDDDMNSKSPHALCKCLCELNLTNSMSELFKLAKLIVTIPSTTASVERTFSALKRIKTYLRATQSQERLTSLSIMAIEKYLLRDIMSRSSFYDDVIQEFCKQERRINFMYK